MYRKYARTPEYLLDSCIAAFIATHHRTHWNNCTRVTFACTWIMLCLFGTHTSDHMLLYTLESLQKFALKVCTKHWYIPAISICCSCRVYQNLQPGELIWNYASYSEYSKMFLCTLMHPYSTGLYLLMLAMLANTHLWDLWPTQTVICTPFSTLYLSLQLPPSVQSVPHVNCFKHYLTRVCNYFSWSHILQ